MRQVLRKSSLTSPSPPIHLLLLDWDSTLTTHDTLFLVAGIGYTHSKNNPLPPWTDISEAYISDYKRHEENYRPRREERKTLDQELRWLESLRGVERSSVERVERAGIFKGVKGCDVESVTHDAVVRRRVNLRPGWASLLNLVEEGGGRSAVVSVNWSARFVRACLECGCELEKIREKRERWRGAATGIRVVANEIEGLDTVDGGGGSLSRYFGDEGGIWTAGDKGRAVRQLVRENVFSGEGEGDKERGWSIDGLRVESFAFDSEDKVVDTPEARVNRYAQTIYVGDSVTDLECLMLVDVGICIRDEPLGSGQGTLKEVLERISVDCMWIGEMNNPPWSCSDLIARSNGTKHVLWWARDFEEIRNSPLFRSPAKKVQQYVPDPMRTLEP
ncbi:MAG: hypothetical protein M1830_004754 [Pleopsidium flavum]|nr:MAG: hypothetical protein M1830_004754 [Pleopsidium flavum]